MNANHAIDQAKGRKQRGPCWIRNWLGKFYSGRTPLQTCLILALSHASIGFSQNQLPNPGFEEGRDKPAHWRLANGDGQWSDRARQGQHALRVEGRGDDQSVWHSEELTFTPGGLYRFRFFGRQDDGGGGSAISGISRINRDFRIDETWRAHSFVFRAPDDVTRDYVRLGQWHANGGLLFDDVELLPVLATHKKFANGLVLGEAESVRDRIYRFTPNFGWTGANFHRPLRVNHARFNSDRWLFHPGAELIYRLEAGEVAQTEATLRVAINHHVAGILQIEASQDGHTWQTVTNYDGQRRGGHFQLPSTLFPTREISIRLSQKGPGSGFQVNTFDYEAALAEPLPDAEGETHFLDVHYRDPKFTVHLDRLEQADATGQWRLNITLTNRSQEPGRLLGSLRAEASPGSVIEEDMILLPATGQMSLTCPLGPAGAQRLHLLLRDETGHDLFTGKIETRLGLLSDRRPGHWLTDSDNLGLWWCESGWKIGRDRGLPDRPVDGRANPVSISLARGEFEPAQIILRPNQETTLLKAEIGPLRDDLGNTAPISVRLDEVAYVHVTHPTDSTGSRGWYPDPLPPLRTPLVLQADRNQPLWMTFHASRTTAPGRYRAELTLKTTLGTTQIPITVLVYDFALPEETHLKSAMGLGTRSINRYHKLSGPKDRKVVFEKYLKNFAEHRISPYSFSDDAPMKIRFVGEGTNRQVKVDFTAFDQAASKWIDEHHFNTFRLPLRGMGSGTFHSRRLGRLDGFEEGTPEHARLFRDYLNQVETHLRERGWLDNAFIYWFDEPAPRDYEFVIAGMERIKAAAPGLRRMLTEQPEPSLLGHVEIWCGLTPEWTPQKVQARRDVGEEVWWYICTGPKAPYVTEFIDHPGTEMRLWPWQSWQYGVEGLLIWATIYWTSPAAFPSPGLQDPWTDPMSYVSGYDYGAGHIGRWGNGDGRFLYPPRRHPEKSQEPNQDAPINSLRWENLRDGMEDYEYFWLLQQAIQQAESAHLNPDLLKQAGELLNVPADVSRDLTHFTTDPRPLLAHRDRMARMIEQLNAALESPSSND